MDKPQLIIQPRPGGTHAVVVAARDESMRQLLACTLSDPHYLLHEDESEDGTVALAQISRPSLVVIDSDLRVGDGVAACRRIKEHRLTRDTAVVVISADATPAARAQAHAAGADAFLVKPFSPMQLGQIAAAACGAIAAATRPAARSALTRNSGGSPSA
ncbi:MAG: response regulator, partial [Chloroflexota bacterium]